MSEIRGVSGELTIRPTATRTTPLPADRQFRTMLESSAVALMQGVEGASSFLPAGSMIAAAVRGSPDFAASGQAAESPATSSLGATGDDSMRYLELQRAISDENLRFTTLSNVLKAKHETAKAAVNNIR